MTKYTDLKDEASKHHFEGIDYVFGQSQLKEYFERTGYTEADIKSGKLVGDGFGGIGTREAFKARDEWFNQLDERIKAECTPEEIFKHEWWNHECGYTGDHETALRITRCYFPKYTPTQKLLNELQAKFDEIN